MPHKLRTYIVALALVAGGVVTATAQTGGSQEKLQLSPSQEKQVNQGLSNEMTQSHPGLRGQVGEKLPSDVKAQPMPNQVTQQVPETREYLYVKLPDRILLIDPSTQMVAEVIMPSSSTTGSGAGGQ
jgi:hypothetical protein